MNKYIILILSNIFVLLLLTLDLTNAPGAHGDEAWSIIQSYHKIQKLDISLSGMNYYTGSLFQIISTAFFSLFSFDIKILRLLSVSLNLIALNLFYFYSLRFTSKNSMTIFLLLLTGTSPYFLINSRIGVEILALGPLLLSLGLIFSQGSNERLASLWMTIASSFFFALFIYNHSANIFIVSSGVMTLLLFNPKVMKSKKFLIWIISLIFLVLTSMFFRGWHLHINDIGNNRLNLELSQNLFQELLMLPSTYFNFLTAKYLYLRTTGHIQSILLITIPSVVLILSGLYTVIKSKTYSPFISFIVFTVIFFVSLIFGSNYFAINYVHLYFFVLPLAWGIYVFKHKTISTYWISAISVTVIMFQLYIFFNYFLLPYKANDIQAAKFPVGSRLLETSSHHMPMNNTFKEVTRLQPRYVFTHPLIFWNLETSDLDNSLHIRYKRIGNLKKLLNKPLPPRSLIILPKYEGRRYSENLNSRHNKLSVWKNLEFSKHFLIYSNYETKEDI